ncbi:unnamed protein product [Dovyalis caffra]|uniref:Uncharacterized protein n=1 Tax=Dovyalis caffra TaxID=77055 RepID=A0AAV1RBF6_9ROSI|nr:unnamed protein product [Dovyalis caffra]
MDRVDHIQRIIDPKHLEKQIRPFNHLEKVFVSFSPRAIRQYSNNHFNGFFRNNARSSCLAAYRKALDVEITHEPKQRQLEALDVEITQEPKQRQLAEDKEVNAGYPGSSVNNHHYIPRQGFNNFGGDGGNGGGG